MKTLFFGPLWDGSTSLQRFKALRQLLKEDAIPLDLGVAMGTQTKTLWARVRWKLGWPVDVYSENDRLIAAVEENKPEAVIVEGSKVISRSTLRHLRKLGVRTLAYYTPDDVMAPHNLHWPLRLSFPEWDVFFTTKTFNIPELKSAGVKNPILVGKSYDAALHVPMTPAEVGEDYERYDLVFIGAWERERMTSVNALGEAGFNVVVYGGTLGNWNPSDIHPRITVKPAVFGAGYTAAMHHGKVALCFLRKINRDLITQRTMEITAMGRPMLAEKTNEHDEHFKDGEEYVGFTTDENLIAKARMLLNDERQRMAIGFAGRHRCLSSGYSSDDRAKQMLDSIRSAASSCSARVANT